MEENRGVNFHTFELSSGFLEMTTKSQATKEK